jgi:probable H4MPT-linked C1 transfer pathway protein
VPLLSAASNWLALSTFAGRYVPTGPALLVDVGSTTTDVVPLQDGQPVPRGRTDSERLRSRELVYTGVRRTPLCALLGPRVAAELFATTLDAYLVLGHIPEDPLDRHTADGCPATRAAAHARLARMYCADSSSCTEAETWMLADEVRRCQLLLLAEAVERVARSLPQKPVTLITAGSGEFLIQNLAEQSLEWSVPIVSLAGRLGPAISEAACAYAVAVLAEEHPDAEG